MPVGEPHRTTVQLVGPGSREARSSFAKQGRDRDAVTKQRIISASNWRATNAMPPTFERNKESGAMKGNVEDRQVVPVRPTVAMRAHRACARGT